MKLYFSRSKILQTVAILSITIGLLVVSGWILNIQLLMTIIPGYVSMKINTALFFIISGSLITFLNTNKLKVLSRYLALFLIAFALSTLLQDILLVDFGIDQLFIADRVAIINGNVSPGRPSPVTALCFALLGIAFVYIQSTKKNLRKLSQYLFHIVSFLSFIAIVGYLFHVPVFYKLSFFTSMAVHTSISLFVISLSLTIVNPKFGIAGVFIGKRIGNIMARSIFKKVLPAILILGFTQLVLLRYGIVSVDFGIAIFTTCFIIIFLYSLWSTKILLNRIDEEKRAARNKLKEINKNLEQIVEERTAYLTQQNKQLEDFSQIISHNLRGPMSNLMVLMKFYREEETIESKDKVMQHFNNTIINMSKTLEDLLNVVTIRHESKREKVLLHFEDVFFKIVNSFNGKILENDVSIITDFSNAPTVKYSSVYLESIIQNLLSNSLKYHSKNRKPEIKFETKSIGDKVELSAIDNGLGIDLELNKDRIFGLHKTFHKHPEAKGVGLFITKAQVEAMGGKISVESKVNNGSTFKILF